MKVWRFVHVHHDATDGMNLTSSLIKEGRKTVYKFIQHVIWSYIYNYVCEIGIGNTFYERVCKLLISTNYILKYVLNVCLYCVFRHICYNCFIIDFFYKLHKLFLRTQTLEMCSCQQETRLTWYIKTQTSLIFHALASLVRIFVMLSLEPPEHSSGI